MLAQSVKILTHPPQFRPICVVWFGHSMLTEVSLCCFSWVIQRNGPATQSDAATQSIDCLTQEDCSYTDSNRRGFCNKARKAKVILQLCICMCKYQYQ